MGRRAYQTARHIDKAIYIIRMSTMQAYIDVPGVRQPRGEKGGPVRNGGVYGGGV